MRGWPSESYINWQLKTLGRVDLWSTKNRPKFDKLVGWETKVWKLKMFFVCKTYMAFPQISQKKFRLRRADYGRGGTPCNINYFILHKISRRKILAKAGHLKNLQEKMLKEHSSKVFGKRNFSTLYCFWSNKSK